MRIVPIKLANAAAVALLVVSAWGLAPIALGTQYIYSLSTRTESSRILGVSGVPAAVTVQGGSRRGLYITAVANGGQWSNLGLRPGDVLISIDNRVMTTAAQADAAISQMSPGVKDITFARLSESGVPSFIRKQAQVDPSASSEMKSSTSPGSARSTTTSSNKAPESISSLESYGLTLINNDRTRVGSTGAVSMHPALSQLARAYAQRLIQTGRFAHQDEQGHRAADRARAQGLRCDVSENLSFEPYGYTTETQMVKECEENMMSEPANMDNHRSNILNPSHRYVGVGIARDKNRLVMVHEFSDTDP